MKTHRWLRPRGLLINLQPFAKPMRVEMRIGAQRRVVGSAQDSADKRADMRAALRRVAEMVAAGRFSLCDEVSWRFQMEHWSEEDWNEFAEKPDCGGVEADPRQLDEALAHTEGCVILTEYNLASVYQRLDPGST